MKVHRNARLTFARRYQLVRSVLDDGLTIRAVAAIHGVSSRTARKWLVRFAAQGEAGLHDGSSKPRSNPRAVPEVVAKAIVELRRLGQPLRRIAQSVGYSTATVSRLCARLASPGRPRVEPPD